jgi:hypothetical protein
MATIPYHPEEASEHTSLDIVTFWSLILLAVAVPVAGVFYLRAMGDFDAIGAFCIGAAVWLFCLILLMALVASRGART